jgi:hypothetical protein
MLVLIHIRILICKECRFDFHVLLLDIRSD